MNERKSFLFPLVHMNFSKNMVLHPLRQHLAFPGSTAVTAMWGEPCREAGVWVRGWVLLQGPCTQPSAVSVARAEGRDAFIWK